MGAGAVAGASAASSLFGGMGGNDQSNPADVGAMNALLSDALGRALPYSQNYTNLAVGAQQDYLNNAMQQLQQATGALMSGQTQSQIAAQQGFDTSQALQSPYREAGYNALDTYMDSLGLARAGIGSSALARALTNDATAKGQLNTLQSQNAQLNNLYNPGNNPFKELMDPNSWTNEYGAPIRPTAELLAQGITPAQAAAYIRQNSTYDPQTGKYTYIGQGSTLEGTGNTAAMRAAGQTPWTTKNPNEMASYYRPGAPAQVDANGNSLNGPNTAINNAMNLAMAEGNLPYANSLFNSANSTYSQLGQTLGNYTPEQQQIALAYNRGLFSPTTRTALY